MATLSAVDGNYQLNCVHHHFAPRSRTLIMAEKEENTTYQLESIQVYQSLLCL